MTQKELRAIRLKNDYEKMASMRNRAISWTVDNPDNPEHYVITYNIRTIVGLNSQGKPIYRDKSTVDITFPPEYPMIKPRAVMREQQPFHVNWYTDRSWCPGHWSSDEALWSYIRRMGKTIQFDKRYTNPGSAANPSAKAFWLENQNGGIFPTDKQELPVGGEKKRRSVIHL